ncbi:ORF6N domain-containing protein [Malaciobacter sp. WC5094]|uniref:ORF6N domain-containing protein n=1 Tax=Arcobacter sp. YIC-80 TaxID=3376683 RepID=UPI00384F1E72
MNEFENWRSQFVTSNSDKMGLRSPPYTFTEQGISMLSAILKDLGKSGLLFLRWILGVLIF